MRIVDRYLITLFLRQAMLVLAILVGLYGLIEFIERVDDFISHGASLGHYLRYPLVKLPVMVAQTLPMSLFLAAFATIGQLSRTNQLTALRSNGVSFAQCARPLFACGVIFSLVMLIGNAWLVPWSIREARYILNTEISGKQAGTEVTRDLYLRDGQRILSVAQSFPQRGEIQGIMILDLDLHFHLTRRMDAASGRYDKNHVWRLEQVTERRFDPDTQELLGISRHEETVVDLGRDPEEFTETWVEPAELTIPELLQVGERMRRDGQDGSRYVGELHFRLAQSLTPLIVILLGLPFALQRGRSATLGTGIALSLGIFVVYIMLQAVGMALGTAGLLPLPLAAWSANLLLLLTGSWLFLTLDN